MSQVASTTLYCVDSNEIINIVQMAMLADLDYRVLRDTIFTHPSVSEILNRPSRTIFKWRIAQLCGGISRGGSARGCSSFRFGSES